MYLRNKNEKIYFKKLTMTPVCFCVWMHGHCILYILDST